MLYEVITVRAGAIVHFPDQLAILEKCSDTSNHWKCVHRNAGGKVLCLRLSAGGCLTPQKDPFAGLVEGLRCWQMVLPGYR